MRVGELTPGWKKLDFSISRVDGGGKARAVTPRSGDGGGVCREGGHRKSWKAFFCSLPELSR